MDWRARPGFKRKRTATTEDKVRSRARGKAWKKLSRIFLAKNPLCVGCEAEGLTRPARVVDHILPFLMFPEKRYDENNLQALCRKCHNQKGGYEKRGEFVDYRKKVIIKLDDRQWEEAKARQRYELAMLRRPDEGSNPTLGHGGVAKYR